MTVFVIAFSKVQRVILWLETLVCGHVYLKSYTDGILTSLPAIKQFFLLGSKTEIDLRCTNFSTFWANWNIRGYAGEFITSSFGQHSRR